MIQDGDGEQTSLIKLSMTASYEAKGGGCYREVTVMGGTGVMRNLFCFFCESKPGHFLKLSCLRTANKCIGQGIFSILVLITKTYHNRQ